MCNIQICKASSWHITYINIPIHFQNAHWCESKTCVENNGGWKSECVRNWQKEEENSESEESKSVWWPKPWFVSQSFDQGHTVLEGFAECRCTCVALCFRVSVCWLCALSPLWNARGNWPTQIKGCLFFCSKCACIFVHTPLQHAVCVSIITCDQRQAPLSVLLIFLCLFFPSSWKEVVHFKICPHSLSIVIFIPIIESEWGKILKWTTNLSSAVE